MTTCPSTGSTPDHMLPSLMALKPHSLSCWWRSGDNIPGSYLTSNSPYHYSFQFSVFPPRIMLDDRVDAPEESDSSIQVHKLTILHIDLGQRTLAAVWPSVTPWRKWRRFTWRLQWWSMLTEGPGQWLLVAALWATLHSAVATWYQIILCICMTPSSYAIVYTKNTSTLIMACKTQLRHKTQISTYVKPSILDDEITN